MSPRTRNIASWVAFGITAPLLVAGIAVMYAAWHAEQDRTAQIKALNIELQTREETLADFLQSQNYGVATLNARGEVKKWNSVMYRWTGHTEAVKRGHRMTRIVPPNALAEFYSQFESAMRGETNKTVWDITANISHSQTMAITPVKIVIRIVRPDDAEAYAILMAAELDQVVELGDFTE